MKQIQYKKHEVYFFYFGDNNAAVPLLTQKSESWLPDLSSIAITNDGLSLYISIIFEYIYIKINIVIIVFIT